MHNNYPQTQKRKVIQKNNFVILFLLSISLLISGCSLKIPRDHTTRIQNPDYLRCYDAIKNAYSEMVKLKENRSSQHIPWNKINNLLANSLSAMQFGKYNLCVEEALRIKSSIHSSNAPISH